MPAQGRLGDRAICPADAHGCPGCPHPVTGPGVAGSRNVFVNGRPALRRDDPGVHAACCGGNTWTAVGGAATVLINNRPAHRVDDAVQHCGGTGRLAEGSTDVVVGDDAPAQDRAAPRESRVQLMVAVSRLRGEAPVGGVSLALRSTATGQEQTQTTDAAGQASFAGLAPGGYELMPSHEEHIVAPRARFLVRGYFPETPEASAASLFAAKTTLALSARKKPAQLFLHIYKEGQPATDIHDYVDIVVKRYTKDKKRKIVPVQYYAATQRFVARLPKGEYRVDVAVTAKPGAAAQLAGYRRTVKQTLRCHVAGRSVQLIETQDGHERRTANGSGHPLALVVKAVGALAVGVQGKGPTPVYGDALAPMAHVKVTLHAVPARQKKPKRGEAPQSKPKKPKTLVRSAISGADGVADLGTLTPGTYELSARALATPLLGDRGYYVLDGGKDHRVRVQVKPSYQEAVTRATLRMQRQTIRALVAARHKRFGVRANGESDPAFSPLLDGVSQREFDTLVIYSGWASVCGDANNPSAGVVPAVPVAYAAHPERFVQNPADGPRVTVGGTPCEVRPLSALVFSVDPQTGPADGRGAATTAYARAHGMHTTITPLLWFTGAQGLMPRWTDALAELHRYGPDSRHSVEAAKAAVAHHIERTLGFLATPETADVVVVNEPMNVFNHYKTMHVRPFWMPFVDRKSRPRDRVFTAEARELVAHAFVQASRHTAARLILNDYGNDGWSTSATWVARKERFLRLAEWLVGALKRHHVPASRLVAGFQMHLKITSGLGSDRRVRAAFKKYKQRVAAVAQHFRAFTALGMKVQITELAVSPTAPPTAHDLKLQGLVYEEITRELLPLCTAIVLWNLSDDRAGAPEPHVGPPDKNAPTLFTGAYLPKPAYTGVLKALREG